MTRIIQMVVASTTLLLATAKLEALPLDPATVAAWDAYVRATETRIARELAGSAPRGDQASPPSGQIRIARLEEAGSDGRSLGVPGAIVHHWRGSVFIPDLSIDDILARLADPSAADLAPDDVIASRVLERGPGWLRVYLRLQRSQLVTVVYNTEHAVRYTRHSQRRASSRSVATHIAEVADPDTARERERPLGEDRGFLWRLNAYWRYEQVGGGVLVECESISLSRTIPTVLRGAVRPLIDQVARGSMERTLLAIRARFTRRPSHGE